MAVNGGPVSFQVRGSLHGHRVRLPALAGLLALVFALPVAAQDAEPDLSLLDVDALVAHFGFDPHEVGFILFDPSDGSPLVERNADAPFLPASTIKLPTALAALEVLGADHRFRTELLADGGVRGGVLSGDLYLRGEGDPFLDSNGLATLVDGLVDEGVGSIAGTFAYDASAMPSAPSINAGQPQDASYNPGFGALSVNFNVLHLSWVPDPTGARVAPTLLAKAEALDVPVDWVAVDAVETAAEPWIPYLYAPADQGERWILSPDLPDEGSVWLPVKDPARNAALLFRRLAADRGITLPDPVPATAPDTARLLADQESASLRAITEQVLYWSNNLSAEIIGLATARALVEEVPDLDRSAEALANWLMARFPGIDWGGLHLENHSGLSSASRMTPRQMAAVLTYGFDRTYDDYAFRDLLRERDWIDTLNDDRPAGGAAVGLRVKTGTMYFGRGLAGYIDTAGARTLGFAIFASDFQARRDLDARMDVRTAYRPAAATAWLDRARAFERELVTRWAAAY